MLRLRGLRARLSANCNWWCGEGVCLLAIDLEIARECGIPAAGAVCPFECP